MSLVVGLRANGDLQYRASRWDGYGNYVSIPSTRKEVIETRKLPTEKMKMSRTFGIEVSTVEGADFSIDSLELFTQSVPRRSGGS